jgi:dihydroneopterin aldolase
VSARDVLSIRGLETECVVGVYPHERDRPQPLSIDIDLSVDTESAARSGKLSRTVDYDATARVVVFLLQSCRFGLLETAAHALASYLLAPPGAGERRALISAVRIDLTKPQALPGNAVARLTVERDASWVEIRHESRPFGSVDVIHESREARIVRLDVAPRQQARLPHVEAADRSELALSPGLSLDGVAMLRGTRRSPAGARTVQNPSRRWQTLLCVESPRVLELGRSAEIAGR